PELVSDDARRVEERVRTHGQCVATSILCRYCRRLTVAPIVKATFSVGESGPMREVPAVALGDLDPVPWPPQVDALARARAGRAPVRVGIHRAELVFDQPIRPSDAEPPAGAGVFAAWVRAALASAEPIVSLPDDFDWATVQLSPPQHRLATLHGDEWILIGS